MLQIRFFLYDSLSEINSSKDEKLHEKRFEIIWMNSWRIKSKILSINITETFDSCLNFLLFKV